MSKFAWLFIFLCNLSPALTIYTYDSLASKGSFLARVRPEWEKKYGSTLEFVPFASAGEAVNQIALEGKATHADILLGLDNSLLARAKALNAFETLGADFAEGISSDLLLDKDFVFLPLDYGFLGFVFDSTRSVKLKEGISFDEFAKSASLRKKVVIEDPRTSSIGLGLLVWTHLSHSGVELESFWKNLADKLLTIAPGWSGAYGLFEKKEADYVLSYTTSPAYHLEEEKRDSIRALIFPEGHYRQVEGVGVVKYSKQKENAKKFTRFILSPEMQELIPKTQWMYPVRKNVSLPKSFQGLPVPKALNPNPEVVEKNKQEWLREWTRCLAETK